MENNKRIQLLSDTEVEDLYALPEFNAAEQSLYFTLSKSEQIALNRYNNVKIKIYFILQLGYFKAKQQFFNFSLEEVKKNTKYIIKEYRLKTDSKLIGRLSRDYLRAQKEEILALFNYSDWSSKLIFQTEDHICSLLKYYPKGHGALRQILGYLDNQKIVVPSYRVLQDLFTRAYSIEQSRIDSIISTIPVYQKKQLSALIARNDGISQLNIIRTDQKNFKYTALKTEVEKALQISNLYKFSKTFIPKLELSKNAIRYYAEITEQYAVSRLRRLSKCQQWLHSICFVHHRYQQIMDNLIISFNYHIRYIMDGAKTYADMELSKHSTSMVVEFPKLAQFLKWFPDRNKQLTHDQLNQIAFDILPETQFSALAQFLDGNVFDKKGAKWKFYLKSSRKFSLYLRPIVVTIPFDHYSENNELIEMINLLKTHYKSGKSPSSLKLPDEIRLAIPKNMIEYLKRNPTDEQIDPWLFEFYVYQKMYHQIDRGWLCCNDSVSYCDIDNDLIDESLIDNVDKIAADFGYPKIPIYCDKRLDDALGMLDQAWDRTTKNIESGNNTGFNIKKNNIDQSQWSLLYDRVEKLDDTFFKNLPKLEIADIIMFIGNLIEMWNEFTHMKDRYTKRNKSDPLVLNACLLSEAFGFSVSKMADMSDINYNLLRSTREDFVRTDTLCAANDLTSNYIHSLPIFKLWNLLDDKVLADADGQKFSTSNNTIQSRYSKKYIGKGQGISLYTLIANFVAVNAKNIGLNEYEGHSLYDMIYGNKTDIDINSVTGDNHSLNKLNFVTLDAIGVDYIPSIKNVREAANNLYSVKVPRQYTGILQPIKEIRIDRIRSQKRGILRVLLSLIMQENTQSNIIRKLNSHGRYVRLKAALFEYNQIFKSTHVLNLIDDMQLRKAIRTARNRTEAYHQLQGIIRKTYHGVFKGKKIVDNRVSAHAVRLIANCIIAYNSMILNKIYQKMVADGVEKQIIDQFARISPIAWGYILFAGRYSFKKSNGNIDVESMIEILEQQLKKNMFF